MEALRPPPTLLAITAALILGIFTAYTLQCQPTEQAQNIVTIEIAQPVDHVAIEWIRRYNPALSEADAQDMYSCIERTIERYRADPKYQKGAAKLITPKLFLALILRESGAKWQSISDHGAIGLCQVMPLHVENLYRAGVIESSEVGELLDTESNIKAGIHILMVYAKSVDSITRALSRYNAGPSRERAGRGYARAVLKLYEEIGG